MHSYDPERMELSTRDRVALACYTEIKEGRGTPNGGVWLDVSHLPRETIMTRLPRVYQTMLELQMLDITTDPIEIAPTAHYSMGGVWVRPEDHCTDVPGLYAIGEASSRSARRQPPGRQLAHRAARLRAHRRPGRRRVLGGAAGADALGGGGRRGPRRDRRAARGRPGPRTCARCSAPSATR